VFFSCPLVAGFAGYFSMLADTLDIVKKDEEGKEEV
jgi:hypothetical protein